MGLGTNSSKDRHPNDAYDTPASIVRLMRREINLEFNLDKTILEPCAGSGVVVRELVAMGYHVSSNEPRFGGFDYLSRQWAEPYIITNPPFKLFSQFVQHAKTHCEKFMMLCGVQQLFYPKRLRDGIWENLKSVNVIVPHPDFRYPQTEDGKYYSGGMLMSAWYLWDMRRKYPTTFNMIDGSIYSMKGKPNCKTT